MTAQLVPRSDGCFDLRPLLLSFVPIKVSILEGRQLEFKESSGLGLLIVHEAGHKIGFGVCVEPIPIPQAWMDRLGEYETPSPRGETAYDYTGANLRVEDDFLVMQVRLVNILISKYAWSNSHAEALLIYRNEARDNIVSVFPSH